MVPSRARIRLPLRGIRRHRVLGLVLPAVSAVLLAAQPAAALAVPRPNWNPGPPWAPLAPASTEMHTISNLFWIMLVLSAIIFIGVTAAIMISIFRFRARPGQAEPEQVFGNRNIEIAWTVLPFVVLIVAFGLTVRAIHDINTPAIASAPTLDIDAIGHQWWWEFDYPALSVTTANEVHVPTGYNIHFHVESADVVHSFWVPRVTRQIDANPGQDNAVFAILNTPGTYDGACYEYCGTEHAFMKFRLIVQSPAQFKAWIAHESSAPPAPTGEAALGRKVFLRNTCVSCHAIASVPGAGGAVGPNLSHVASRWSIGAGAAPMDMANVMQWIHDPNYYKPGVYMPAYPLLSQKDLRALAAYILSLK